MTLAEQPTITIGSHHTSDVVIGHPSIRPFHCRMERRNVGYRIVSVDGPLARSATRPSSSRFQKQVLAWHPHETIWLSESIKLPVPFHTDSATADRVGRATDMEIQIDHPSVSGLHATVFSAPHQAPVIVDHGSTNGLFVDRKLRHRVSAIALLPGQCVFFGSHPVASDHLIASTLATGAVTGHVLNSNSIESPEQSRVAKRASAEPLPHRRPAISKWLVAAAVFSITGLLLIFALLSSHFGTKERHTQLMDATGSEDSIDDSYRRRDTSVASPVEPNALQNVVSTEELSTAQAGGPAGNAIGWLAVQQSKTNALYRVGAVIHASGYSVLVTPASVLTSITELTDDGFEGPFLIHPHETRVRRLSGRIILWDSYKKRYRQARQLEAQHTNESGGIDPQDDSVVHYAWQRVSATDVGWIEANVDREMGARIEFADQDSFHVGERLILLDIGFDAADPFWSESLNAEANSIQRRGLRLIGRGPSTDSVSGTLQLSSDDPDLSEKNMIGCPLLRRNTLVGVIVYQSKGSDQRSCYFEAIPSTTFLQAMKNER
ncbi:FHA domain-containing protein [Roseiconus lacunae]|uniref:FHA domain-containing protein n=1 Tax=Roseiconus lacunae TaxID=2605694 RepID=UPI003085DC75|nr:FHA domain-containing protein [Stieleria sp. HD01]